MAQRIRRWASKKMFDVSFNPFGLTDDGTQVKVGILSDAPAPRDDETPAVRVG